MVEASDKIQKYFDSNISETNKLFEIASKAREQGFDPSLKVDIKLAKDLAERVVGLISIVAPQVENTEIVPRIQELEKKYGIMDWRVAMEIAYEIAQEKFCKFDSKLDAMTIGIKLGFAYVTVGVVSSPLEGLTDIEIKKRLDGKGEYFCLNFAGPIRNAGGTSASVGVLIADFVRRKMGYEPYDCSSEEAERCYTELIDYHNRVTNLQYVPSKEEILFLCKNIPVEISGMASEKFEVSNHKDLPRIPTNLVRSGFCLVNSSCIPLKAPKLWKQLNKWGKEMELDQWDFLDEFIEIQHKAKAGGDVIETEVGKDNENNSSNLPEDIDAMIKLKPKIDPNYVYIKDLVAGRPVFSHPLRSGGFRMRYGKSRTSGYSAQSMHPATLEVMDDFITTATQLKVELPGKAAAITVCDTIKGPVVSLKDGSVVEVDTLNQAKSIKKEIKEIIYAGDILCNYGDFYDRAHNLVFPGYCEEWWALELEKEINAYFQEDWDFSIKIEKIAELLKIDVNILNSFINDPLHKFPSSKISIKLSKFFKNLALHPKYTYFYTEVIFSEFVNFLKYLSLFRLEVEGEEIKKIILPYNSTDYQKEKRVLEIFGIPHFVANNEFIIIEANVALSLLETFSLKDKAKFQDFYNYCKDIIQKENELLKDGRLKENLDGGAVLYSINKFSDILIKNKAGTFIGARMGRPEKAKMRKMQTGPHGLFPVGDGGGRFKSFEEASRKEFVEAEYELWWDEKAGQESVLPLNYKTGNFCVKKYWDNKEKVMLDSDSDERWVKPFKKINYDFKNHFKWCLDKMKTRVYPDVIKGVVGSPSSSHSAENPIKAILRAKHNIFVNKDGTVRYDGSEVPITHFKPKEVGSSMDKLKNLGYTHDIYGEPLVNDNQILELFAQDVILPACDESPNEAADDVFLRTTKFIDDELEYLYGMERYYNLKSSKDLVGHLVIVLAPHTSAGTLGRIVGFTKTQGLYCHPLMHAAIRRDCDGDEGGIFLLADAFLNFSTKYLSNKLGGTMDAPLVLTSILNPTEVDDMVFNIERSMKYPLDFYEAAEKQKKPWDVKFELVNDTLGKKEQFEGFTFTHDTDNFNDGVKCSSYKLIPSMKEKLDAQLEIGRKLRAVDEADVAKIVIEKHFTKDTRGNLRKFSQQTFRCTKCNTKYRRPPLSGKCLVCNTPTIIFTVSEGSVKKYIGYSIELANKYNLPDYLKQSVELTSEAIDSVFGKEAERQEGLNKFFN